MLPSSPLGSSAAIRRCRYVCDVDHIFLSIMWYRNNEIEKLVHIMSKRSGEHVISF